MRFRDYYKVLGLARDATQADVKGAYRRLARKYHPDVSREPDAEARFKEVGEAYEVLKDPEKRAAYDRFGSQWKAGQEFHPPPDWDAGFEFRGGFGGADFSDFFESLFGGAGPFADTSGSGHHEFRSRGEDHHAKILISLEDAYHGNRRSVRLQLPEVDGRGRVGVTHRTLNVTIPRGIAAGQQIRLAGQGAPGSGGGNSDLYLEVEFEPHGHFRAEGRDIHGSVPITPWEAALGAQIPVRTLGGIVEVRVPAGAQSGQKLRLKGRGLPGQRAGDHYVELRMVTPPASDAGARDLYRRMATHFQFDPRRESVAS